MQQISQHIYNFRLGQELNVYKKRPKERQRGREREREERVDLSLPTKSVVHEGFCRDNAKRPWNGRGRGLSMETTRGGKWRACKRKNAAKHEGGGGEGGREFEERRIRESYFNILSALRGITHTHEWTANIWNGPQTWHGWPPSSSSRERETNSSKASEKLPLKIADIFRPFVGFPPFARLEMYVNGLPTDIGRLRYCLVPFL